MDPTRPNRGRRPRKSSMFIPRGFNDARELLLTVPRRSPSPEYVSTEERNLEREVRTEESTVQGPIDLEREQEMEAQEPEARPSEMEMGPRELTDILKTIFEPGGWLEKCLQRTGVQAQPAPAPVTTPIEMERSLDVEKVPSVKPLSEKTKECRKQSKRREKEERKRGFIRPGEARVYDYPLCQNCQKRHSGVCLKGSKACYHCKQIGHFEAKCPNIVWNMPIPQRMELEARRAERRAEPGVVIGSRIEELPYCSYCREDGHVNTRCPYRWIRGKDPYEHSTEWEEVSSGRYQVPPEDMAGPSRPVGTPPRMEDRNGSTRQQEFGTSSESSM